MEERPIYCPFCGIGNLLLIESTTTQKSKVQACRCDCCRHGWEVVSVNGNLIISESKVNNVQALRLVNDHSS